MTKKLSDMSLEELWRLFPIVLTAHQACWAQWYREEEALIKGLLPPGQIARVSHVGSTAVGGIWAKPIVDILLESPCERDLPGVRAACERGGYLCMSASARRVSLNKGYTPEGFAQKVFHLHVRCAGDHDELYFRDYLIDHPDAAREYEQLKLRLWPQYRYDRDGYTNAKTAFIARCTRAAKEIYAGRYE